MEGRVTPASMINKLKIHVKNEKANRPCYVGQCHKMIAQCLSPYFGGSVCLGPVVQSIVSLTSPLLVKLLTVLVSTCTISNSQVFLLKKNIIYNVCHLMIKVLMIR